MDLKVPPQSRKLRIALSTLVARGLPLALLAMTLAGNRGCVEPQSAECAVDQVCPPGTLCGPGGTCPADPNECERFPDGTPCADAGRSLCQEGLCLPSKCGDGIVDEDNGELCDLGEELNSDAPDAECRTTCLLPVCGDGIIDSAEACDTGQANSDVIPDQCRMTCVDPFCGDGIRDRGEDEGCFGPAERYDAGLATAYVVVADLDGDGLDDAVASNFSSDGSDPRPTNSVFLGTADGGLMPMPAINTGKPRPRGMAVADWSADGDLDLAVVNGTDDSVTVFLGGGDGTFGPPSHYETGGSDAVAAGLIDDDPYPDLAVIGRDSGVLSLLLGSGQGSLDGGGMLVEAARVSVGVGASVVAVTDLDADGTMDALITNEDTDSLLVLFEVANVSDPQEPRIYDVGEAPIGLVVEDVDQDGQLDVIVANKGSGDISILRNLGGGELAPDVRVATAGVPTSIKTGLIDDDDLVDIVFSHATNPLIAKDSLSLLRGTPGGGFEDAGGIRFDGIPSIAHVTLSDLNRDGRLDAVMASFGGQVITALAGDGTLGRQMTYPLAKESFAARIGDLDRDGWAEVLVVETGVGVEVFRGLPNTRLAEPVTLLVGEAVRDIEVADVNYDTHLDVVAVTSSPPEAVVLFGDGTGALKESGRYPVKKVDSGTMLVIDDLDRDGILDLVVGGVLDLEVHVLRGHRDGSFEAEQNFGPLESTPAVMRVADLDGDGILDLLVSAVNRAAGVFRGTGNGTFDLEPMASIPYIGRESAVGAIIGDDDLLDIIYSDPDTRRIRVLENKGSGEFELSAQITLDWPLEYMEVADLNGDGQDDLAGVDTASEQVIVLLGREKGVFAAPQVFSTGAGPQSIATGDLNGDSLPDLAVVGLDLAISVSHWSGVVP